MTTKYKDFTIDIIDDSDYTPNSTDNLNTYDKVFLDDAEFQPVSKHGIKVSKDGVEQTSAIICETGERLGFTTTHLSFKETTYFYVVVTKFTHWDSPT